MFKTGKKWTILSIQINLEYLTRIWIRIQLFKTGSADPDPKKLDRIRNTGINREFSAQICLSSLPIKGTFQGEITAEVVSMLYGIMYIKTIFCGVKILTLSEVNIFSWMNL